HQSVRLTSAQSRRSLFETASRQTKLVLKLEREPLRCTAPRSLSPSSRQTYRRAPRLSRCATSNYSAQPRANVFGRAGSTPRPLFEFHLRRRPSAEPGLSLLSRSGLGPADGCATPCVRRAEK